MCMHVYVAVKTFWAQVQAWSFLKKGRDPFHSSATETISLYFVTVLLLSVLAALVQSGMPAGSGS